MWPYPPAGTPLEICGLADFICACCVDAAISSGDFVGPERSRRLAVAEL